MMKLKDFSIFSILLILICNLSIGQSTTERYNISGTIISGQTKQAITNAEVYNKATGAMVKTNAEGFFKIKALKKGVHTIVVFNYEYKHLEQQIILNKDTNLNLVLQPLTEQLSEVVLTQRREKIFAIKNLRKVEGTAIYAGKKTEVVLLDQLTVNKASNNARQIYAQVAGLNIYENGDAGLQLNIGGRGLDPNRTANFNTRQNGYDISADVLGYPESYYTPPAEAISEIQVVRGAASLQYGTQFGGLINFKLNKPNPNKKIELISRQTIGSNNLKTSFNSLSGTANKFSYYTYFNYKQGDGVRNNSQFSSRNFYLNLGYNFTDKTKITFETTILNYLAKQPGGLTDTQFNLDPSYTNRTRNWFDVDWKLFSLRLDHKFSSNTDFSLNIFALDAHRKALGFRDNFYDLNSNPITDLDEQNSDGDYITPRDLLVGNFKNWGAEARLLTRYTLADKNAVFLIGAKYYNAKNTGQQGPGSTGTDANFDFKSDQYPVYPNQYKVDLPNLNVAIFGENIYNFNDKFSITPGFRFEYIKTGIDGTYKNLTFKLNRDVILNETIEDIRDIERSFLILGLGASYKASSSLELYSNISQNYRSVTFSDIRTKSSTFVISNDIKDETGYTADIGARGTWKNYIKYDVSIYGLMYDDRISNVTNDRAITERGNIGKAFIYGIESFSSINLMNTLFNGNSDYRFTYFLNLALTNSEYLESKQNNVEGNKVEFIPAVNLKTGVNFGYKNLMTSIQYTSISKQFTEASNAQIPDNTSVKNGLEGEIPAYDIFDFSLAYTYKKFKLETGINNVLNKNYYTRRATGYPGPGVIPSELRTFYTTLQFKW